MKSRIDNSNIGTRRESEFLTDNTGTIISCALVTKEDVDAALENAPNYGGAVASKPVTDERYGGYIGYVSDPDGHLWELVYPQQQS